MRRSRTLTYVWAIVTASLSCGDPGGPGAPPLAIDDSITPMIVVLDADGWPQAVCNLNIHLVAGAKPAKLVAGLFKFFTGTARSAPSSTSDVALDELEYAFGNDSIAAGDTVETQWNVYAGIPFEVQFVLRFSVGAGEVVEQSDKFSCGPNAPETPAAPPVLNVMRLNPSGIVAPGEQLGVTYMLQGTQLWATELEYSGAFSALSVVNEGLAPLASRTISRVVPPNAKLGTAVDVSLWAFDMFGQYATGAASSGPVSDTVAPAITAFVAPTCCGPQATVLRNNYFTGDVVSIRMQVSDSHKLSKVVWELLPGSVRDSVLLTGKAWADTVAYPAALAWLSDTGQMVRVTAWDSLGNSSQVVLPRDTSFRVVQSLQRPKVTHPIAFGAIELDTVRNRIYVTSGNALIALDATNMGTVFSVPLDDVPLGMDATVSGDTLVIALLNSHKLAVVDVRGSTPTKVTMPMTWGFTEPRQIVVAANGKVFVTLGEVYAQPYSPIEVNLTTGEQKHRTDAAPVGTGTMVASPERDIIVSVQSGCAQVYLSATDTFGPCKQIGGAGQSVSVSRAPHTIAIRNTLYDAGLNKLRDFNSLSGWPSDFSASLVTPDGQFVFHRGSGSDPSGNGMGMGRSRVSDGVLLDRSPSVTPGTISADGKRMYFRSFAPGGLAVVDIQESSAIPLNAPLAGVTPSVQRTPAASASARRHPANPRPNRTKGVAIPRPFRPRP